MFNMKKFAKKGDVETNETRLNKQRKKYDASLPEVTGNMNDLLSVDHKDEKGDKTHEGQAEKVRVAEVDRTTDGQLEHHKSEFSRTNTEKVVHHGLPLNNLALEREKEHVEAFNKASEKQKNTELWDKFIGDQLEGKVTKQPGQNAKSQLNTANEIKDNKQIKEMVMASLKDADAMLFHIYRSATGRELTSEEKTLIDGINADKIKIMTALEVK